MTEMEKTERKRPVKQPESRCESCEFYEDDGLGEPTCGMSLDEDEFALFAAGKTGRCPYYRYYDEYETVRKQN